jgi:hypothetical protein
MFSFLKGCFCLFKFHKSLTKLNFSSDKLILAKPIDLSYAIAKNVMCLAL